MDLSGYLRMLRSQWRVVVGATLVTLLIAVVYVATASRQYAAQTELFVSLADAGSTTSAAYQGSLFGQERAQSYADIVNKRRVTTQVIDRLGLQATPEDLGGRITATVPDNTVLIDITVTDDQPRRAQAIANTVADVFIGVVDDIETPTGSDTSPVKVSVVDDAALPDAPVSPRTKVDLVLGLVLGLLLGAAAGLLRATLDTRIRDAETLKESLGLPVLGVIPRDKGIEQAPLVAQLDRHAPRVEAFRQLRTNLRFLGVDRKIYSLVVTSPLPVEGKSLTTCNLAVTLAEAGLSVIVLDADLRRPSVASYFGLENAVGLSSVLSGQAVVGDALQSWGEGNLRVLPSGPVPPNPTEMLESHRMADLLSRLQSEADVVLIDAPPVLPVADATVLGALADGVVLVAREGRTRQEQVERAIEALRRVEARLVGTVLNADRARHGHGYGSYRYGPDVVPPRPGQMQRRASDHLRPPSPAAPVAGTEPAPAERPGFAGRGTSVPPSAPARPSSLQPEALQAESSESHP